ncbi:MAG TPA: N-acetylmuramoyl-L-alanine amidase [Candidatus Binatia bacterium]|nr:N-acetylmuramoyl-L-alanine amidase [Candidatus Binatia bacterium]
MKTTISQRGMRWAALLVVLALPGGMLHARGRSRHSETWAREHYAAADRMREALNGRPPAERTRRDYQRVLNAYRNVYFGAPTSSKADPSAVAVAETLVEMGRRFDDDKILNGAIAQYKFLRREYPGSRYRCDALFTIGEIYKDDLNDPEQARATFTEFLKRYPHNRLAEDAQQAVTELDKEAAAEKKAEKKSGKEIASRKENRSDTKAGNRNSDTRNRDGKDAQSAPPDDDESAPAEAAAVQSPEPRSKRLPRVTAIRHWSTPDYTRVAIDLESEIKFGSQRISNPDRIFFDLRDTKLASTLVGKSFDVDDGFLKKIRVAQFQPGRTRVVLEVDDLSDYEAFLLPNPYRLIIDIHGKDGSKSARGKAPATHETADVEAPPTGRAKADDDDTSPADAALADDSAAVTKTKAKEDLRAEAGKAPVTTTDVNDDTKVVAKSVESAKRGLPDLPRKVDNKKESPLPTKVVVNNYDDDDDADAAPRRTTSQKRSRSSSKLVASEKTSNNDIDIREARPTARGDRSLIRALGLKIGKIVIDPGHGGHDTGTIGPNGLEEKDLVLEVGRRLGKLLETRLGAEVVYTRKNDTFIPLETRTAIANQQRADLFISIHANSSRDPDARGVETYYLNFTSSPEALEVAARENAVSEQSIYQLQDLVKKIALKEKIEESREFAGDVQESLHNGLAAKSPAIRNRGVKKAPFIVLIGANMPSILAEISFVSNPTDEHRLETSEYRERIAESLYHGIAKYVDGLSGVKMASKMDKAAGQ